MNDARGTIKTVDVPEADARQGLMQCLFEGLKTHALGRIMHLKVENHRLQQERQLLNARLRRLQHQTRDTREQVTIDVRVAAEMEDIRQKLGKIERSLLNSRLVAPEESLNQVHAVFKRPDDFVRISKTSLRLNKMCVKIDERSTQPCNKIDLTEVVIGDDSPRVVTLAKFPSDELLPPTEFLSQRIFS